MIAIALTFASYLALLFMCLGALLLLGVFLFDSITISTPKRRILQVTKK